MAVKTFTAGSVLTASDTNTYLNNGGLVYVTSLSWSSVSADQQINACFTSTYDGYMVVMTTTQLSANPSIYFQLCKSGTPTAANYYWGSSYVNNGGTTGTASGSPGTSVITGYGASAYPSGSLILYLFGPQATRNTVYNFTDNRNDTTAQQIRTGGGNHSDATTHDGILVGRGSGSWSGKLTVYGIRTS